MKFEGTQSYVATDDLKLAVNAAITLQRPLLVKGEPGTGKTMLAEQLAESFGAKLITWHIKSTTKAHQGLYEYDAVSRLRDSQLGVDKVHDVRNYIKKGKLWEAFEAQERVILLIDEIDKADIEFPNDLLQELDKMEFYVYETNETIKAKQRPIIIITSNNEKELPDAFLRRCFFHYIAFPDRETLQKIVDVHYPNIKQSLVSEALDIFFDVRKVPGLKKKPSTSELVDWLKLLMADEIGEAVLRMKSTRPSSRPVIVIAASAARPTARRSPPTARCAARRSAMSPERTRWPNTTRRQASPVPSAATADRTCSGLAATRTRRTPLSPSAPSTRRCHR